jgi:hypothetical protein
MASSSTEPAPSHEPVAEVADKHIADEASVTKPDNPATNGCDNEFSDIPEAEGHNTLISVRTATRHLMSRRG